MKKAGVAPAFSNRQTPVYASTGATFFGFKT